MSLGTYVIDANTVISAALKPASMPQAARSAARVTGIIALSLAVYQKVAGVLSRPKFTRILNARRRMDTLELLLTKALWAEPVEAVTDCRDAKDNKYLELALAASATVIVSGDDDLLVLNPWRGVRILTSAQLVKWAAA